LHNAYPLIVTARSPDGLLLGYVCAFRDDAFTAMLGKLIVRLQAPSALASDKVSSSGWKTSFQVCRSTAKPWTTHDGTMLLRGLWLSVSTGRDARHVQASTS
jgi:hypothetical protein